MENWKPVVGYEGRYEVSDQGRIRSNFKTFKIQTNKGYQRTYLTKDKKTRGFYVHRLVYEAFVGPISRGYQIDHKGDKTDNRPEMLLCVDRKLHRRLTLARRQHATGERIANSKLTSEQVEEIKELLLNSDLPYKVIGEKYGVHFSTIQAIASGRTWVKDKSPEYLIGYKDGYKAGFAEGFKEGIRT